MTPLIVPICNKERVHEIFPEVATGCVLLKKVFLNISPISQENTYVGVFLNKIVVFRPATLLKRNFNTGVFL